MNRGQRGQRTPQTFDEAKRGMQDVTHERQDMGLDTEVTRRSWTTKIIWTTAALAVLALVLFGRGVFGQWARHMANRDMDAWAISDAQRWLDRAERFDPDNPATLLLRAKCFRHLGQLERRTEMLEQAGRIGASKQELDNEITLGQIQSGDLAEGAEAKLGELTASGLSPHDIASAYIDGNIVHQDMERALDLLQAWSADFPGEPHVHYMRGVLWSRSNERGHAREEFEKVLAEQPRHELAQIALAQLYEEDNQYQAALELYVVLASRNPGNENLLVGLARLLRKLGRLKQARTVLAPAMARPHTPSPVAVEAGEIELESGNYELAEQWFQKVSAKEMVNHSTLSAAALNLAMLGQTTEAETAFEWIINEVAAVTVMHDLRARLQANPNDEEAASEFQLLIERLSNQSADENPLKIATSSSSSIGSGVSAGMQLYGKHCAACHGPEGAGDGRAARHLYPRPRNLRLEKMRLISTRVGVPTTRDIIEVIRNGIPGTAMASLDTLRDSDLEKLATVVRRMRREGVRDQYIATLLADDEEVDAEDVAEVVAIQTNPREMVTAPAIEPATAASVQLGKQLYTTQTCDSCHGASGTGDDNTPLFDDLGRSAFPRDLVHEHFKGGNTAKSIYLRISLGMPGSPHPANVDLAPRETIALVDYCLSLGKEPKTNLTNHQRAIRATSRPALEAPAKQRSR